MRAITTLYFAMRASSASIDGDSGLAHGGVSVRTVTPSIDIGSPTGLARFS